MHLGVAHPPVLVTALGAATTLGVMGACTASEEPRPAPIVARRLGGDSMAPGVMVIHCRPEDEGCVPT
jgi:hypothetical protein